MKPGSLSWTHRLAKLLKHFVKVSCLPEEELQSVNFESLCLWR